MSENVNIAAQAAPEQSYIARTSGLKGKDYIGYAMGDTACCLVFGLVTSLLQKFYTDVFALSPLFIMLMMVGARVWDAINDPIMGRVCDSVKPSKWGRYRPWFLYASIPLVVCAILMFVKWPGLGEGNYIGTAIYATVTYVLFGMCYTMLQIPYGSLASVVTTDEKERTKLSVFRSIGAGVGSLPVILIASFCYQQRLDEAGKVIIGENGRPITDMMYTPVIIGVVVLALVCFVMLMLAFKFNKERVQTAPAPKRAQGETKRVIKSLFKSRSFVAVSVASMLLLAGQMFTQSFYLYLFDDLFGNNALNTVSTICTYAPMVIFMFFTPKLVRKFGKKEICAVGMVLAAAANIAMFAMRAAIGSPDALSANLGWLPYAFLALCFISGCGMTFMVLQVWSMATDAIDDVEVKTGIREDGTSYALFMFFRKLGQVIAAVAVNGALIGMNYKTGKGAVQTFANLQIMYDLATIIPAVLFAIMALVLFVWYPLSRKKVALLQVEKEKNLKEAYENNLIGIDGDMGGRPEIIGDIGLSDVPEFIDDIGVDTMTSVNEADYVEDSDGLQDTGFDKAESDKAESDKAETGKAESDKAESEATDSEEVGADDKTEK